MSLEDTFNLPAGFRLTVLKVHGVGPTDGDVWGFTDLLHDRRTGLELVDRALDELLLVCGAGVRADLEVCVGQERGRRMEGKRQWTKSYRWRKGE